METQNRWGIIVLATGFAILAIGVAGTSYLLENKSPEKEKVGIVVGNPEKETSGTTDSDHDGLLDWQEVLWKTDPYVSDTDHDGIGDAEDVRFASVSTIASGEEALAGSAADHSYEGLSTTEALSLGIAREYETLNESSLDSEERARLVEAIIRGALPTQSEPPKAGMEDLSVSATVRLDVYANLLTFILRESSAVREYELSVFARAVRDQNHSGSPELTESATIYSRIRDGLAKMEVPASVANEHLAVMNEIGALAHIVSKMSTWDGDPTVGLIYVEAFDDAERGTALAIDALVARITALAKTQSS